MTKRTIKEYEQKREARAKKDRPATFLGCTCSNTECGLTWIVCEMPQPMHRLATLTAKHKHCPHCGTGDPLVASVVEIRALLGEQA